jgi:Dyp-type peroxidase family
MALIATDLSNFDLLSNLQGNILKGHGREHTTHIFVKFEAAKVTQAKKWIKNYADTNLTSAQKQLKEREVYKRNGIPGGLFSSFYLTAKGYVVLGLTPPVEASFNAGMNSVVTQTKLNDPLPATWDSGYQGIIHAMVLLAHDNPNEMGAVAQTMIEELSKFSKILHVEYGHAIRNANGDGIEHFGYVDGVSQPLFLQDEVDDFKKGKTLPLKWDPEAPLSLVLVPDFPGDTTANGSYFVFRKLEQQVRAFKEAEEKLASNLGLTGDDAERAGAMIVGRYEDGTPLTLNEEDGIIASGAENNFNYNSDTSGAKCPFHAHIRKSNPRGEARGAGVPAETLANEKKHIMARRGIPFGHRDVDTSIDPSIAQSPVDGVGLLFMSYQASIGKQFEFIQQNWVNNPGFPHANDGSDPILGQGIVSNGKFAVKYGVAGSMVQKPFNSFVTLKGGEYFFAPSVKFLKNL